MPSDLRVNPSTRVENVGRTGIYPASGPLPEGDLPVRGQGALAHPEERARSMQLSPVSVERTSLALGRALFGGYFLYNGINHFLNRAMLAEYARSKQVPAADVAVLASGTLILLGGLSLLTGIRPKLGASLITTFLAGVTPQIHAFWKIDDEQQRMQELVNFTKNLALIGGAAFAAANSEPWPGSAHTGNRLPMTI
jgi:putative oxidoreductase